MDTILGVVLACLVIIFIFDPATIGESLAAIEHAYNTWKPDTE